MQQSRYRVLERIDSGGMAEVFRGVATSIKGYEKVVAIKRVLPHLTRKHKFVRMFLDEARLSLVLNHANIVQVFDLGSTDGTYFIVMEYVDGVNMRTVMQELFSREKSLPIGHATYIAIEVCKGLAYAHTLQDVSGRTLGIVHRDVSPPNILLSLQGEVKITDFGLAKARSQLEHTDPGIIKGKFGYLSPEAAYGETIDSQTDIFALGVVLWEMLAGRRLFAGATEPKTLELVRKAVIPRLRSINPDVPENLDNIVQKALARDRGRRYHKASEMSAELTNVLFDNNFRVTNADIGEFAKASIEAAGGGSGELGVGSDYRRIDDMVQEEIERMISLDESMVIPIVEGGGLEDPSNWFSDDAPNQWERIKSVEVRALSVGPEAADPMTISTLIPIDVVQEAIEEARARGDLDWMTEQEGGSGERQDAAAMLSANAAAVYEDELLSVDVEAFDLDLEPAPAKGPVDLRAFTAMEPQTLDVEVVTSSDEPIVRVAPESPVASDESSLEALESYAEEAFEREEEEAEADFSKPLLILAILFTLAAVAAAMML